MSAATRRYLCGGISLTRPVMRYVSRIISLSDSALPQCHCKSFSSSSNDQQEIFSKTVKTLWPKRNNLDPRDVPRQDTNKGASPSSLLSLPIVHIRATFNNTIITITDSVGRTLAWTSSGAEGFKNARKGTSFAAQSTGTAAGLKASALGLNRVRVQLKGMGPGRQHSLKGLESAGLNVAVIQDVTPIPHNGCKPKKKRRL